MYLTQSKKKNGRIYPSVAESYRESGKTKTRSVRSLGYVDELEKEHGTRSRTGSSGAGTRRLPRRPRETSGSPRSASASTRRRRSTSARSAARTSAAPP